jgi:hypothetical protein
MTKQCVSHNARVFGKMSLVSFPESRPWYTCSKNMISEALSLLAASQTPGRRPCRPVPRGLVCCSTLWKTVILTEKRRMAPSKGAKRGRLFVTRTSPKLSRRYACAIVGPPFAAAALVLSQEDGDDASNVVPNAASRWLTLSTSEEPTMYRLPFDKSAPRTRAQK